MFVNLVTSLRSNLGKRGQYKEAEMQLRLALRAAENFGSKDPRVAVVLNNLGSLSHNQGKRDEAQSHYERALSIREEHYGPHDPWVAQSLNNIASLYREQEKYVEAEKFIRQAVELLPADPIVNLSLIHI